MSHDTYPWVLIVKYSLYAVVGWGGLYFKRWRKRSTESAAQSWPGVEARIVGGKSDPVPKTTHFLVTLQYTYFLDEYRSGEYIHEFNRESEADDFLRAMRDQKVQIRYHPTNPNRSVLEQSVVEQIVLLKPRFG